MGNSRVRIPARAAGIVAIGALLAGMTVASLPATSASADTTTSGLSPIATTTAQNVTADALPTVQIDGVAWSQAVSGNTVYAGGSFANARPPGAAAGTNQTARANLLAYDITTGALNTNFAPTLNAQALAVAVSPDGSRLYVGGDFTTANGVGRNRIAAFNTSTGALITTFNPGTDAKIKAIAVTGTAVYVGGLFSTANNVARSRVAAFDPANGALLPWNPSADYTVNALALTPAKDKVIIGGAFQNLGGAPAYGLAATNPSTGALLNWNAANTVRDAGTSAAIESLSSNGTSILGTGYVFGAGGNLEGTFSANPDTGNINWVEDCHGDSYSSFGVNGIVYVASHAHYCGNIGGFPQSSPNWTFHRATAFTDVATGTIGHDPYGYYDWFGTPSPSLYDWFPDFTTGTATGQNQASWNVSGNSNYVVYGGEFPTVNGTSQQGLVRFATRALAPNKEGPRLSGARMVPSLVSLTAGTVRVSVPTDWDRDDTTLTYKVTRDSAVTVFTGTRDSVQWNLPSFGFTDTGLAPGSTHRYRIQVTDPSGNSILGDTASIVVSSTGSLSTYAQDVKRDGVADYWRLGEASGTKSYDWSGYDDLTANSAVVRGAPGAVAGDTDTASTFDGSTGFAVNANLQPGPNTFTEEAWFRTTSSSGGKIVGFGDARSGNSNNYDRHLYMDPAGHVFFGVYDNAGYTINTSTTLNDGQWHHAVGTLSTAGMVLYVDGKRIGVNGGVTKGQPFSGYWRVGGDSSWNGNNYFQGDIDEVAIYPSALSLTQVRTHYLDSGRTFPGATAPADKYGKAVYTDQPDVYYRMDDASGPVAVDSSGNSNDGSFFGNEAFAAPSNVSGPTGSATTFDGQEGSGLASPALSNPSVYSTELWFNTTTTGGGKLIGFGSSASGRSGSYDRHVYMESGGQLTFGTWTGQANIITSSGSYNDGNWHQVVATQGPDGMNLYVDGISVGTNPNPSAQAYDGYWRVGGDTAWNGTAYFAGTIDEVAIYSAAELTATQVLNHYNASSAVNHKPTASFTSTETNLTTALDATASSDVEGPIASYAWDFGDGATGTGSTTSHTYSAAGTYKVTLTVTDNGGVVGTSFKTVTVVRLNAAPKAAFTQTTSGLQLTADGGTSTDSDGTIAGYSWSFGDGSTDTGKTTSHLYVAGGTYTLKLTVTDDDGATNTASQQVTVVAPNAAPTAAFTSGAADLKLTADASSSTDPDGDGTIASYAWTFGDGGTGSGVNPSHTYASAGMYSVKLVVTDNAGASDSITQSVTVTAPNQAPVASFTSTTKDLVVAVDASASRDPDGSVANYGWDFGDNTTGTGATLSHTYAAGDTYTITLTVTDNKGLTTIIKHAVTVLPANKPPMASFISSASGLVATFDATASADSDGTIMSYAWNYGDGSNGTGATPPSHTYAAAGTYSVVLTVTDDRNGTTSVTHSVTVAAAAVNKLPTAAFTSTVTAWTVAVDGSASTDSDGSVSSYAWDFGDGSSGTGKSTSHKYATSGSFTVKLTVTDNSGGTDSVTHVVVTTEYATDAFARTSTGSLGVADVGGAWTVTGSTAYYSVGSGTAKMAMTKAGSGPTAYLSSVSARDTNSTVDVSLSSAPTGGGVYLALTSRRIGTSEYRLRLRLLPTSTTLSINKIENGTETVIKTVTISGLTYAVGTSLRMRFMVSGSGTTNLSGKVWKIGAVEPTAYQVTTTDTTSLLQAAGAVGLQAYLSAATGTTAPITASFDNVSVKPIA